jgi:hypothetical protein
MAVLPFVGHVKPSVRSQDHGLRSIQHRPAKTPEVRARCTGPPFCKHDLGGRVQSIAGRPYPGEQQCRAARVAKFLIERGSSGMNMRTSRAL